MKILFSTFYNEELKERIKKFSSIGYEVITYNCHLDKNEETRFKNRHFQMYESILNFAQKEKIDIIYFHDYLTVPEYLLAELKVRPDFTPKIIFSMFLREANRSLSRAQTIKELLDMPQVIRAITFGMGLKDFPYPETMIKVGTNFSKIKKVGGVFYSIDRSPRLRKNIPTSLNDIVMLYPGRWIYSKGTDIFVEATKYIDKDITILAHKNPMEDDYGHTIQDDLLKNHPQTTFIEKYLEPEKMRKLFFDSHVAICSHRRLYEYSETGIPGESSLAKIPIIAPDFNFFREIINKYKTGILYEPENPIALANAINKMKEQYNEIAANAKFEESIKNYVEEDDIPKIAMEDL
jgi:glycosyltransferase involved in cell wall biosynthesis